MRRLLRNTASGARHAWLRRQLAEIGAGAWIDRRARIESPARVRIGTGARVEHGAVIRGNTVDERGVIIGPGASVKDYALVNANRGHVRIGERTWIGPYCLIYGNGGVEIGSDVLVAGHTSINTVSHVARRTDIPMNAQGIHSDRVVVEDDVWIGLNCTILQGVTIGRGSIIGAGAVVTRDIPAGSIALGVPARVVGHRTCTNRTTSTQLVLECAS